MSQMTCSEFIEVLASSAPAPGGGGAAALCGAIGTALGSMVASLTIGKKKYADVEDMMVALKDNCAALQQEFLSLIDEDAKCFEPLAAAYKLPKSTPEEEQYRNQVLEKCSVDACQVPLKIMECCARSIDMIEVFAEKGSVMAVSDAGCAAITVKAALQAASLNVFINTKDMKDRLEAESLNAKAREIMYIYESKADRIFEMVSNKLTGRKKKEYGFEGLIDNPMGMNMSMDF